MHPLQKQFHDEIIEKQLFRKEQKVLLAVSGGVDSMVLAHLLLMGKYSFGIAHCNFGLRGNESDGDEQLVRLWAKKNGITCHIKQFKLEGSIQLAARNARYEWFYELMKEHQYELVATAHHLNDSLETSLLNLSRGTGIKGLAGISSISGKVVRPLLFATKNELIAYAKEQDILWREDASNEKTDYGRNLIRHEVVPALKKLNPSLDETFKNTVERLQLTNKLLERQVDEVKSRHLKKEDKLWKLEVSWVQDQADLLVLSEIVSEFGFNYVIAKEIYSALTKSGKTFHSERHKLTIDRACVFITKKSEEVSEELLIHDEGYFDIGAISMRVSKEDKSNVVFGEKHCVYLDASKITFPLTIRNWKEGDRFKPLGMSGSKKVSDYLIDNKVPLAVKGSIKVVISNGSIVWLVGHQISEDFKISSETESALKLIIE